MDVKDLSSLWPEDVGTEADNQFNVEKPTSDEDMLKEANVAEKRTNADFMDLPELMNSTLLDSSHLLNRVKQWERMQNNAVWLLREELKNLARQREEAEAKELEIIEEYNFETDKAGNVAVLDETSDMFSPYRADPISSGIEFPSLYRGPALRYMGLE